MKVKVRDGKERSTGLNRCLMRVPEVEKRKNEIEDRNLCLLCLLMNLKLLEQRPAIESAQCVWGGGVGVHARVCVCVCVCVCVSIKQVA